MDPGDPEQRLSYGNNESKDSFLLHLVRQREPQVDGALPGVRRVEHDGGGSGGAQGCGCGRRARRRPALRAPPPAAARDRLLAGGAPLPRHGRGGPHPRRRDGAGLAGADWRRARHRQVHAQPADPADVQGFAYALRDRRRERPASRYAREAPGRRRLQLPRLLRDADRRRHRGGGGDAP